MNDPECRKMRSFCFLRRLWNHVQSLESSRKHLQRKKSPNDRKIKKKTFLSVVHRWTTGAPPVKKLFHRWNTGAPPVDQRWSTGALTGGAPVLHQYAPALSPRTDPMCMLDLLDAGKLLEFCYLFFRHGLFFYFIDF